jgi:hypothetical protein
MNNLSSVLSLMLAISVAVERVVEILKGIFPFISKSWKGDWEYGRFALLQVIATLAGAAVAYLGHAQIAAQVPVLAFQDHLRSGYLVIGLMASGGSAMWNHALDIVQAMKIAKGNVAPVGR